MKKFFTFFATILLALTASAKTWNVPINQNDALKDSIIAATPGDTILLSSGKYLSPDQIHLNKSITIMAAKGASPIIPIRWYSDLTGENTKVNIIGVKFVGNDSIYTYKDNPVGASDHCICPQDTLPGKELHLENCEFVGFPSHVLYNDGKKSLDSLVVNNCYFHNNDNSSVIYFYYYRKADDNQSVKAAKITNSTFANNGAKVAQYSVIYIFNKTQSAVSDVRIDLDHCTFYNNPTENTDHSCIRSYKSTNVAVSNCIFAHSEAYGRRATCLYGGTISNCLTYNLTYDSAKDGHRTEGGAPVLSGNFTADPLFVDTAKGDLNLQNNYVTGKISPAYGVGTNKSNLGDPRWYTDPVLPDVDFSEPYVCAANKAQLVGKIAYKQPDTIYYYDEAKGTATWRFNATKACYVQVALNITKSSNDHKLKVYLIDNTTGVKIDSVAETAQNATVDDIDLGVMLIPTTGDYSVQLSNMLSWSAVHLSGITLTKASDLIDIYLKAGVWDADKPKFGVYVCEEGWWPEFMENAEGDLYVFRNFPANKILLNFVRFNNTADAPSDTYKWNEVVDMTRTNDNNCFKITGWGSGTYSTGEWRKYFPGFDAGYYLVGTHNSWEPTAADIMDENVSGEYKKIKDVAEGDKFKAIRIDADGLNAGWYPDGSNNEYRIPAELAGNVTIYFKPAGDDNWSDANGGGKKFYVEKNSGTAIDNTVVGEKAVKVLRNGQLFIEKDGKTYNLLGTVVK